MEKLNRPRNHLSLVPSSPIRVAAAKGDPLAVIIEKAVDGILPHHVVRIAKAINSAHLLGVADGIALADLEKDKDQGPGEAS